MLLAYAYWQMLFQSYEVASGEAAEVEAGDFVGFYYSATEPRAYMQQINGETTPEGQPQYSITKADRSDIWCFDYVTIELCLVCAELFRKLPSEKSYFSGHVAIYVQSSAYK